MKWLKWFALIAGTILIMKGVLLFDDSVTWLAAFKGLFFVGVGTLGSWVFWDMED